MLDAWMFADLALCYEQQMLLNHQKDRHKRLTSLNQPENQQKTTVNLLKSPVLTIINLLADRGDLTSKVQDHLILNFESTNIKIQNILEKNTVENKSESKPEKVLEVSQSSQPEPTSTTPAELNIYNLNFNEKAENIFNKKNSSRHKTVEWINRSMLCKSNIDAILFRADNETDHMDSLPESDDENPIENSKEKINIPSKTFNFDDIPINRFHKVRREINSAFSLICWDINEKSNFKENVQVNIPISLNIRSIKHLQKGHRTGISRPGSGDEYSALNKQEIHDSVANSKEVQELQRLPTPLLIDAVHEAVSLGLMSVYEAKTLLDIIHKTGKNKDENDEDVESRTKIEDHPMNSLIAPVTPKNSPNKLTSRCQTREVCIRSPRTKKTCLVEKVDPEPVENDQEIKENILHHVGLLNPYVGFEPMIYTPSPVVEETEVPEVLEQAKLEIIDENSQLEEIYRKEIYDDELINNLESQKDGCMARPCTATFD